MEWDELIPWWFLTLLILLHTHLTQHYLHSINLCKYVLAVNGNINLDLNLDPEEEFFKSWFQEFISAYKHNHK